MESWQFYKLRHFGFSGSKIKKSKKRQCSRASISIKASLSESLAMDLVVSTNDRISWKVGQNDCTLNMDILVLLLVMLESWKEYFSETVKARERQSWNLYLFLNRFSGSSLFFSAQQRHCLWLANFPLPRPTFSLSFPLSFFFSSCSQIHKHMQQKTQAHIGWRRLAGSLSALSVLLSLNTRLCAV